MDTVDLTKLKPGQKGVVVQIEGGTGLAARLERMGIRSGKKIIKVSAQIWKGPQSIKVGNMQFAVGFGVAKKIIIKLEK